MAHSGVRNRPGGPPSLARANAYFAAAVAAGWLTAPLQQRLGLAGVTVSQVLLFVVLPLLFSRGHAVRETFRLRPVSTEVVARSLLAGGLAWVAAQGVAAAIVLGMLAVGARPPNPYAVLLAPGTPAWVLILFMAGVPALAEEFAFRGLVLSGYRSLGPSAAWVAAGLLFGLMHMSLLRLPNLAGLGMLFAYAVQRTGSLIPAVVMHFTNNALTLGLYLAAGRPDSVPETASAAGPGALLWIVLGAATLPALRAAVRGLHGPRGVRAPAALADGGPPPSGAETDAAEPEAPVAVGPRTAAGPGPVVRGLEDWLPLLLALPLILPMMAAEVHQAFASG
ncbi:CPBP family intramembrane glutamic endopeptidase [Caldinitratiruptor microaerophilus]|uniref:CAAX prenyl protease 2/Lysostaphin resistance protein A-like domain-containing protein n=1 Tax=Caldinitratiruptor microaerophilus TaxID=671077 RepID=A0AA35CM47_9FIRM|nr:CPBP family intramembrane glutamic endopeptidase [Caldinitratiruptor microaerophilus]BDG61672.1 hypothetical protein caldi_27620 [Caldinitratiruptor microaerophilus]